MSTKALTETETDRRLALLEAAVAELAMRNLTLGGHLGWKAPALADVLELAAQRGGPVPHPNNLHSLRNGLR